jgi:hypothetical protein
MVIKLNRGIKISELFESQSNSKVITLTEDVNSVSIAMADVKDLAFNFLAEKSYEIKLRANRTSSSLSNGAKIAITSTSPGFISGNWDGGITNLSSSTNVTQIVSFDTPFVVKSSAKVNTDHHIKLDAFFTPSTDGILQIQWASEVKGSSSNLLKGSSLIVTQLN